VTTVTEQPSGLRIMLRAAAGSLPFIPRAETLPARTLTVDELPIDRSNVAAYAAVTGLRYGDTVPLTYPFTLTFPTVMALVTGFDFPFAAMGAVHVENHITRYRPIAVTDTVGVKVHAENLREHRKAPHILFRRGWALLRKEPALRRAAEAKGCETLTMRQASARIQSLRRS